MKIKLLVLAVLVTPGIVLGVATPAAAAATHPKVSAAASHYTIYLGNSVTVHGTVRPNQHGHAIHLQRYYSRKWHELKHTTLSKKSTYSFTTKPGHIGSWTYRAYEYRTSGRTAAASRTIHVTVKAKPRPACHPLTNGGKCYEPGETCRNSDHGVRGVAGDGKTIKCENKNGWRWEPV